MFDRLLLLCKGQTAYFGNVDNVIDFFQDIGLQMKPHYNPADFIRKLNAVVLLELIYSFLVRIYLVEQIKSTPEIREKIIAAARAARKSASYPAELNSEIAYSKDQGLIMEDYRLLSGLAKHESCLQQDATAHVSAAERTILSDEEKHLWMDSQSHSSSASSSDSADTDFGLGYPTSFITQFKVSIWKGIFI